MPWLRHLPRWRRPVAASLPLPLPAPQDRRVFLEHAPEQQIPFCAASPVAARRSLRIFLRSPASGREHCSSRRKPCVPPFLFPASATRGSMACMNSSVSSGFSVASSALSCADPACTRCFPRPLSGCNTRSSATAAFSCQENSCRDPRARKGFSAKSSCRTWRYNRRTLQNGKKKAAGIAAAHVYRLQKTYGALGRQPVPDRSAEPPQAAVARGRPARHSGRAWAWGAQAQPGPEMRVLQF